jgi:hypothetical protein
MAAAIIEFLEDRGLDDDTINHVFALSDGEAEDDEDWPPANKGGKPGPLQGKDPTAAIGRAMDARTEAMWNAARIAVTSYPTASQIAADRAAQRRHPKSQTQIAMDAKKAARSSDTLGGFFERYPGAKKIGYVY